MYRVEMQLKEDPGSLERVECEDRGVSVWYRCERPQDALTLYRKLIAEADTLKHVSCASVLVYDEARLLNLQPICRWTKGWK